MFTKYRCIIALIVLMFSYVAQAQVFPVNVTPQVIPPYSLKLSEYSTSVTDKLILNLLLTDITESNRQVNLKFYVENNAGLSIQSNDVVIGANPIFLDGGVPLRLSNIDLQPYFQLQNLRGINPQQYSIPLPEGLYRFCFEVYDAQSGQQISRKSCTAVYLVLNDPPFLNIPNRGEQVLMRDPQNIIFQWTPRHLNATNVEYEFTLAEIWDNQMDPQAAFLASRPLYQTNTFATTLLYGPGETPLLPDKTYGWRVRAMVSDGISETSVFKNDGYSEIYYFTYTGSCGEPEYILAEAKSTTSEKILWQGVEHLRYNVQYRKKDTENAIWFENGTINENTTIYNLEPGTTYEFRVGGQCLDNGPYTYSQIYQFTTTITSDETSTYNCGITPEIVITNQDPLEQLVVNEVFTAGDFPVKVKEVEGANGSFSGWGYIVVPYLQDTRLKVSFDGIRINTDYQLMDGVVVTDYDENWGGVDDIQNEIDAVIDLTESILDVLEDVADKIREGELTGEDIDALLDKINGDLPADEIADVRELSDQVSTLEDDLAVAETEEEKEEIQNQIDALNEEIADKLDEVKDKISDLIIKAIEKYYRQNKSQESNLLSAYEEIYNLGASSSDTTTQEEDNVDGEFEFEFEGEAEISNVPEEFTQAFDVQEKFHLYFFSKAIAENKEDKETIKEFITKALETDIDLPKILKKSQDDGDSEIETIETLMESVEKALKGLIDKYKYNYLEQ
ncbi:fibronectin type III domain-containing protein [Aquimarina algiphila]|uniref:fibronectin type III domain-containing protein n=1 Tax=Aquimarina algiphila TaxID=2047982 RepID=UPI0024909A66|nr:fibronectin type III domain-containing protein [Aquimarina algiphila]